MRTTRIVGFAVLTFGLALGTNALAQEIYRYDGDTDAAGSGGEGAFDALDGTFSHDNGSDEWDGSGFEDGNAGGVQTIDGYLRIQDPGDPRDHGMPDPGSNRKIYLGHDLGADGAADTFLDDGVILEFRARIPTAGPNDVHPDGGGAITPYPSLR